MDLRRRTAFHESGHLLAGLASPHAPQPTGVSVLGDSTTSGRVSFESELEAVPRARVDDVAFILLSGLAAEEALLGAKGAAAALEEHGAGGDMRQLAELLLRHRILGAEADALVKRATEQARRFVREVWPLLEGGAGVLERTGTLSSQAIATARLGLLVLVRAREEARRHATRLLLEAFAEEGTRHAVERARKVPTPAGRFGRA